jgi:hypothetical protein
LPEENVRFDTALNVSNSDERRDFLRGNAFRSFFDDNRVLGDFPGSEAVAELGIDCDREHDSRPIDARLDYVGLRFIPTLDFAADGCVHRFDLDQENSVLMDI